MQESGGCPSVAACGQSRVPPPPPFPLLTAGGDPGEGSSADLMASSRIHRNEPVLPPGPLS